MRLNLDFETKSLADLTLTGTHVYAEHESTDLLCAAYAFGEEAPKVWYPGDPIPEAIADQLEDIDEIRAWSAQFERHIWRTVWSRYGMPVPEFEQYVCTMAEATAMALPRALGWAAKILNAPVQKDKAGRKLMMKYSTPNKQGELLVPSTEDLARVGEYCATDVETERSVSKYLQRLPATERETYLLDQKINDRGVRVDRPLVEAALDMAEYMQDRANERIEVLTGESATAVTQVQKIRAWLAEVGVETDNLTKQTVIDLLKTDDLPDDAREVLTLRQDNGRTSIGKLPKMLSGASPEDDRLRGSLIYHAASTGRWSGVRWQPQNFPRPLFDPEPYIDYVLERQPQFIEIDHPLVEAISYMLRSMLISSEGHRLVAGDFSQIEARVLHWLAGEEWQDHPYERMAEQIYGTPWQEIEKDSVERAIAKNVVLGAGYQMGWKKFIDYVYKATGITLSDEDAQAAITAYREGKPKITALWKNLERAVFAALQSDESHVVEAGVGTALRFVTAGRFLWVLLPSGRRLAYALPRILNKERPWGEELPTATFMGVNTYTRKWQRNHFYGGFITENVVQALARDIMVHAMKNVEAAGYPVVLTVHDEVVTDTPEDHGSLEEFVELMVDKPDWAEGCSVEVEAWEGQRWRK